MTISKTIKDLNEDNSRLLTEILQVHAEDGELRHLQGMVSADLVKPVAMDISPLGTFNLLLRNKDDKPIVELNNAAAGSYWKIDASETHGKVLGDGWFSSISWSPDEKYCAYVSAARPRVKKLSSLLATEGNDEETRGSKFEFVDSWGEKYEGMGDSCISILNTRTGEIVCVTDGSDAAVTVGQPVLRCSGGRHVLYYTGWSTKPRRLGMIYCYQRPCAIFSLDVTDLLAGDAARAENTAAVDVAAPPPAVKLTADFALARSPRISPDGKTLVFIGRREPLTTHNGCFQLLSLPLGDRGQTAAPAQVRIDIVPSPALPADFPGVFADQLPRQCFLGDSKVVMNTMWGSRDSVVLVDLASTGPPQRLNHLLAPPVLSHKAVQTALDQADGPWGDLNDASCSVLDISAATGLLLFSASSPTAPHRVGLYNFATGKVHAGPLPAPSTVLMKSGLSPHIAAHNIVACLEKMKWKILQHRAPSGAYFESILLLPEALPTAGDGKGKMPLIVVPHGGPHSCTPSSFIASYAYLAIECGCAVLNVNYRGSTGFGQDSIDSLPGNIGTHDVHDMVQAIQDAINAHPGLDKDNMAVVGGSHGGFLTAHLIGQYPSLFKAAAMRNPVTNIPAMFGVTDIPDWTLVECGLAYDFSRYIGTTSAEGLGQMLASSPVRYIDAVKTPSLMCLGSKDRRVPSSQGIDYYHQLQARGVPSQLLIFPEDCHSLDKPCTEAEHFVAIARWFIKYLGAERK